MPIASPNPEGYAMDLAELRAQFPVARRWAYLDHASVSPLATPVRRAVDRLTERFATRGGAGEPSPWAQVTRLKGRLARLLDAEADAIAITRNTTEGILIAADGLRLDEGANVIIAAGEFPANVQPWRALIRRGVEVRVAPERDGRILVDDVAALADSRTAAVAVSWVEFATGFRHDLAALAEVCRSSDALLVVDGIQGLGALRLAPEAVGVDVLACGGHKWMLAVAGIGFLWVSPRALERLGIAHQGWLGVEDPEDFLRYDQPLAQGARRFETGSWDILGAEALSASTGMLLDVGPAAVERRVHELASHVASVAADNGLPIESPRATAEESSGIVIVATAWDDPKAVAKRLAHEHVVVAPRGDGVRVAAHAYNTEEELDRLVELLVLDRAKSLGGRS